MPELIPAAIGAGGSILGGLFNSSANDAAAKSAKYAADLQQKRYDTTRSDLMPYQQGGRNALNLYNNATGVNGPGAESSYYANFQNDPGFQSGVDYANNQVNATSAAQNHGNLGGNQLAALSQLDQNALYGEYHTRLNDLFREGNLGENAAAQTGAQGVASAAAQGNDLITAGQYQGKSIASTGQGISNAANNLAQYYYKNPNAFSGGGATNASVNTSGYDPTWGTV